MGGGGGAGGLENERRGREFLLGPGVILPQKILKSKGFEMVLVYILHEIFSVEKFPTLFV